MIQWIKDIIEYIRDWLADREKYSLLRQQIKEEYETEKGKLDLERLQIQTALTNAHTRLLEAEKGGD